MYVILINNDNTLSTTKKERIVQRSKLFDDFWFLVPEYYGKHDMSKCVVLLEYLKPVSKEYKTEILVLSEEKYKGHLKYILPIDTEFTKEAGTLEVQLSFIYVDIDGDGCKIQRVRKTSPPAKVEIVPISAWSDIIPDCALSAIDQRIIKTDAQIKALNDISKTLNDEKADDILYKDGILQLIANEKPIGKSVNIAECDCSDDGVPVVDFSNSTDFVTPDDSTDCTDNNNVVEFDSPNNNVNNVIEF